MRSKNAMAAPQLTESSTLIVYIIDDDDLMRAAMSGPMRSVGLKAHTFASTEAFLAAPNSAGPSCLLLASSCVARKVSRFRSPSLKVGSMRCRSAL